MTSVRPIRNFHSTRQKVAYKRRTGKCASSLSCNRLSGDRYFRYFCCRRTVSVDDYASATAGVRGNAVGIAPFETRILESANGRKLFVTGTPARHGPVNVDPGDVVGFTLGLTQPGDLLYITGDTLWFDGTAEVARRFSPKIVVLFTGAAEPRGRFHMTMGSEDALEAAVAFPGATLLAVHNEGWGHLRETQDQLADVFAKFKMADRLTRFDKGMPVSVSV